jgi:hypothetical protein
MRDTGEIFEFVNNIKKIPNNINSFISIYLNFGVGIRNIKFSEKYEIFVERADREIVTGIKNFLRPQFSNKRRKLIRS